MQAASGHRLVVEARRGAFVESRHAVWCAVTPAADSLAGVPIEDLPAPFLRSAAKPFQLLPLLIAGGAARYELEDADLAVMAASHDGTDAHAARVGDILARMGIDPQALRCGLQRPYFLDSLPVDSPVQQRTYGALHNNCSGNHAAMLALARHHGVPLDSYLDPTAPHQVAILGLLEILAATDPGVAVDDCGAPCYAMPLPSMAEAYRFLADPAAISTLEPERQAGLESYGDPSAIQAALDRIATAMACEPQWVSGEATAATRLARLLPGEIVAKHGAEGVLCVAHRGRRAALALKVEDGDARALFPALVRLQSDLGWIEPTVQAALADIAAPRWLGRNGRVVGEICVAAD